MSLLERLLHILAKEDRPTHRFEMDEGIFPYIQRLAEREQRSLDDLTSDLLAEALAHRQQAESNLKRWQALSPREQEVAALICLGCTNRQIAARLTLSPETIKTHVRNLLYKFGAGSKTELRQRLSDWDFSAWA